MKHYTNSPETIEARKRSRAATMAARKAMGIAPKPRRGKSQGRTGIESLARLLRDDLIK